MKIVKNDRTVYFQYVFINASGRRFCGLTKTEGLWRLYTVHGQLLGIQDILDLKMLLQAVGDDLPTLILEHGSVVEEVLGLPVCSYNIKTLGEDGAFQNRVVHDKKDFIGVLDEILKDRGLL